MRKLKAAFEGVETTKGPFEQLSLALDTKTLGLWTEEANKADTERGATLDIYNLQMDKGWVVILSQSAFANYLSIFSIAPTLAEIRLDLLEAKKSTSGLQGSVTWLINGISIEDAQ